MSAIQIAHSMTMPTIGISPDRLSGLGNLALFLVMGHLIGVIIWL